MYRNHEGYYDPTAGEALSNVMRDFKKRQRAIWYEERELKARPKTYVVSQYSGDVEDNVQRTIGYCRKVIDAGSIPVASHLLYPQMLNDNDPKERRMGTMFGLALMRSCDDVCVFVRNGVISSGMQREIDEAHWLNLPVRYEYDYS